MVIIGKKVGYNSGGELWSTVDTPMLTVDVRTLTSMSINVEESTLSIRKVDAPMSTSIASVQSEVDAQATTSTRRRRPKLYRGVCVCVYTYTHTHTNTHSQPTYIHIHTHMHTHKHT